MNKRRRPIVEEVGAAPAVEEVKDETPQVPDVVEEPTPVQAVSDEVVEEKQEEVIESSPVENIPSEIEAKSRGSIKLLFVVTVMSALVVGFIAGGVYVYTTGIAENNKEANEEEPKPIPSPQATSNASPTPSPTAYPKDKLSSFKVSVLNGSGKIGTASTVKALMTDAGFTVGTTGNAASFDFTDTVVEAKESVPTEVISAIKKALNEYSIEVGKTLPASSKVDIIVTVGSK